MGEDFSFKSPPILFSVDVEDYFQTEALSRFCPREQWTKCEDRTEGNTEKILDLLEKRGILGTFFVLGWTAERHPQLIKRIADRGHEVASHGYAHELIYRQTPQVFREDIRRAKGILESLTGTAVLGYRAPSYTIMAGTRWALDILQEEGHVYDSSIFPIKRKKYGIPGAPRAPHRITTSSGASLWEFPLPAVGHGKFRLPATGGAYLRLLPLAFQEWAVRKLLSENIPVVFNVHPWELDPAQPKFPVGWGTKLTHYKNLARTRERMERILDLGPAGPIKQLLPAKAA